MDWMQFLMFLASMGAMIWWIKADLEKHLQKLDTDIKSIDTDMKAYMKHSTQRTDQLYQIIIDLLKAQTPKTHP